MTKLKTFLDSDNIECCFTMDAKWAFPHLDWEAVEARFSWETKIGLALLSTMTVRDLNLCLKLHSENIPLGEISYTDVAWCDVCEQVLLPDDECYTDCRTGESLCDAHSEFDEGLDGYVRVDLTTT